MKLESPARALAALSMLALLQSKQVEVLGITIVTGDVWRDEGVQHTLRMLELTGHANVPVVPGAVNGGTIAPGGAIGPRWIEMIFSARRASFASGESGCSRAI